MAEEIITSTNVETATDHEYNASEIQVLKGLEAVRKRPGMYIGSTGERGLHHLVYEIVDNAIDEALAGYCNHIEVKILKNNIIQVTDNGRGIPVDIQADTGLPAVTVVYTILHAGGKFGGENSGYKVAGGLHGVGASVVNACSEWLTVNVRRDGHEYEQTFRRGDPDGPLKCLGTVAEGVTGTRVTFKPDPEMFKDTTVYNFETLEKRLREESFLNAGVKITLTDERELYTPVLEDGQVTRVTGNTCPRGREFAVSEMTAPKRTICSTVRTAFPDAPVLPVRVSADIPKDRIFDVMDAIRAVTVTERIARGDVVIPDVLGLGVDVIATSSLLKHKPD